MANHASRRTTQLNDPRCDEVSLDEVERTVIRSLSSMHPPLMAIHRAENTEIPIPALSSMGSADRYAHGSGGNFRCCYVRLKACFAHRWRVPFRGTSGDPP